MLRIVADIRAIAPIGRPPIWKIPNGAGGTYTIRTDDDSLALFERRLAQRWGRSYYAPPLQGCKNKRLVPSLSETPKEAPFRGIHGLPKGDVSEYRVTAEDVI